MDVPAQSGQYWLMANLLYLRVCLKSSAIGRARSLLVPLVSSFGDGGAERRSYGSADVGVQCADATFSYLISDQSHAGRLLAGDPPRLRYDYLMIVFSVTSWHHQ
jgi:hypothetical protein